MKWLDRLPAENHMAIGSLMQTSDIALAEAGVDLPTVRKINGRKTLAMVMRCTHVHGSHMTKPAPARTKPTARLYRNYTRPRFATSMEEAR